MIARWYRRTFCTFLVESIVVVPGKKVEEGFVEEIRRDVVCAIHVNAVRTSLQP